MNRRQRFMCDFCERELVRGEVKIEQDADGFLYFAAHCHGMTDEVCLEYARFLPHLAMDITFFEHRPRPEDCS